MRVSECTVTAADGGGSIIPSNPHNPVGVARFGGETVDPVEKIECTIATKSEDVVGSECLDLSGALKQEELRQDGQCLEIDGEGPQDFREGELRIEDQRQHQRWSD